MDGTGTTADKNRKTELGCVSDSTLQALPDRVGAVRHRGCRQMLRTLAGIVDVARRCGRRQTLWTSSDVAAIVG
jgi:hypothetical protein